jgi:hypothetical protein
VLGPAASDFTDASVALVGGIKTNLENKKYPWREEKDPLLLAKREVAEKTPWAGEMIKNKAFPFPESWTSRENEINKLLGKDGEGEDVVASSSVLGDLDPTIVDQEFKGRTQEEARMIIENKIRDGFFGIGGNVDENGGIKTKNGTYYNVDDMVLQYRAIADGYDKGFRKKNKNEPGTIEHALFDDEPKKTIVRDLYIDENYSDEEKQRLFGLMGLGEDEVKLTLISALKTNREKAPHYGNYLAQKNSMDDFIDSAAGLIEQGTLTSSLIDNIYDSGTINDSMYATLRDLYDIIRKNKPSSLAKSSGGSSKKASVKKLTMPGSGADMDYTLNLKPIKVPSSSSGSLPKIKAPKLNFDSFVLEQPKAKKINYKFR